MPRWPVVRFSQIRDALLFLGGLAGAAHETLISKVDRPTLLALFAVMMGLPLVVRQDEKPPTPPTPPVEAPPPAAPEPPP